LGIRDVVPWVGMKRIELYRHSIKTQPGNADLSPDGVTLAEKIGEGLRGKAFTHLFVSSLKRTQDTMDAFARAAGDFPHVPYAVFLPHTSVSNTQEGLSLWSGACNRAEHRGEDKMRAALKEEPEIAQRVAKEGAESFRRFVEQLPDGACALVVDHSPFLELVVYGLFDVVMKQLGFCEGFVIEEHDGVLKLV